MTMCGKIPHGHTTVVVGQTLFVILRVLERQFFVSRARHFVWHKRQAVRGHQLLPKTENDWYKNDWY